MNVAAVHCLGGKGRTGVVVACYLFFMGMFSSVSEALSYFAQKRFYFLFIFLLFLCVLFSFLFFVLVYVGFFSY